MELISHPNNLQTCRICKRNIPKNIRRVDMGKGLGIKRLCSRCILRLSEKITKEDIKEIEKWEKEIMLKNL